MKTPKEIIRNARIHLTRIDDMIQSHRKALVDSGCDPAKSAYLNTLYIRADIMIGRLRDAERALKRQSIRSI